MPIDGDQPAIDEAETIGMLRYAIDHGVNYLDTGYPYDTGQHEYLMCLLSRALQDGYRQKVKVAASLPSLFIKSSSDFELYLDRQLSWLQTDRIDFYLLAGLNEETWSRMQELNVLRWAESAMVGGRIDRLGFSFHDSFQVLRRVVAAYDNWTLCQFQYSYMDIDHHPGVGGLKYAADNGLVVVVTEPLKGGRLTGGLPEPVARVWEGTLQNRTLAEWGLRWVWNHPEASTVISDMSSPEQVLENVALADSAEANSLTVAEQLLISRVREAYRGLRPIPCTACRGCMPCPQGIDVPRIFELYNDAIMYGDIGTARSLFGIEQHLIDSCNECGACVNACGKKIAVLDWLKAAHQLLAEPE